MSWNYRVFKERYDEEEVYVLREAYYDALGDERPTSWSAEAVAPRGDTVEELRAALALMTEAVDEPPLDLQQLEREIR